MLEWVSIGFRHRCKGWVSTTEGGHGDASWQNHEMPDMQCMDDCQRLVRQIGAVPQRVLVCSFLLAPCKGHSEAKEGCKTFCI